ncbi:MFS transporter [Natronorubrum thiooxidans]|uniref:Predicted arabinose efflux permease, MFS family n=1 Tax=Natronorubrum thiooxidans TaxID=308853 RepID=A0A1N7EW12_9EURY|nr:MFS transporter [Natronorubrum thiooxidans]SIR92237.1 Predicted arabinose efflux permease, MFS family [Natronorubrum thiooxidans]
MNRPYYGWIVVCACFLGTFVVFGLSYSFGVFLERMATDFARSRAVTTIAFGVQTLLLYMGAVLVGVFVDRLGTRRMLALGTVVLCLGLLWTSVATTWLTVVLAYGVVTGIGMSIVYVVAYATVPRWFDRRAGFAGGVASAGLGAGMLVVAPAATALIDRVGWRSSFLVLAGVVTVLLLVATLLIRDEPTTEPVPAGEFAEPRALETSTNGGREDGSEQPSLGAQFADIHAIAWTPSFGLVFVGWVLIYTTMYIVFVHLVVYASDIGLSRAAGATALAVIGGANAVGRVGIGYVSDYVGRVRVFAGCSTVMGVSTLALPALETTTALLAFAVVFGLAYGGNGALLAPLTGDLFGRENLNAVFGLISGAFALSGLTAPFLAGVGYDVLGTYTPAFASAGLAAVVGAAAIVAAKRLEGA